MNTKYITKTRTSLKLIQIEYVSEIIAIIRSDISDSLLRSKISAYLESDVAIAFDFLKKHERKRLYNVIYIDNLAEILKFSDKRNKYLDELSILKRAYVLSIFEVEISVEYLKTLTVSEQSKIFELMEVEAKKQLKKIGFSVVDTQQEDLREPLKKSIKKRLPWLIILLGLGLVVSSVVGAFEGIVAHLTIIVSFQSLILDMSGNVGTQSLAVTIRVLTDDSLNSKQKLHLIFKESRVGLVNGLILGFLSFALIGLYLVVIKNQTIGFAFSVSVCTGVALVVSILLSGISGTVIPLIFKKAHIDPAVASGPLITTVNDLIAVVSYYGLSWFLLINLLHF